LIKYGGKNRNRLGRKRKLSQERNLSVTLETSKKRKSVMGGGAIFKRARLKSRGACPKISQKTIKAGQPKDSERSRDA